MIETLALILIKKMLEKFKQAKIQKKINKPRYPIHSLYSGRIVFYESCVPAENGEFAFHYKFRPVKNFAILYNYNNLTHIISGQQLKEMWLLRNKDYCVHNLTSFAEHPNMKMYMRKHNLDENSKLSFAQIFALEKAMNKENEYTNENDKMFY